MTSDNSLMNHKFETHLIKYNVQQNMNCKSYLITFFLLLVNVSAQNIIEDSIASNDSFLVNILSQKVKHQIQIIYTQIDRDESNSPTFTKYYFNVDKNRYFYPASTVKLPAAILALEKLNELNIPMLNKFTTLKIDSVYAGQTRVEYDSTAENFLPSIAHYIKKIFLVSDNDAYNRLYEFLGKKYLNEKLWVKRYSGILHNHRLSVSLSSEENKRTNPFTFYDSDTIIYQQQLQIDAREYKNDMQNLMQGIGYYSGGKLIDEPKDFTNSNYFALEDQHDILRAIYFPESVSPEKKFLLTDDDYNLLYKYMSMLPRESTFPPYSDYEHYWDGYAKFFLFGETKDSIPSHIRIFNKVGVAYGFVTDNAYIVDFKNGVEFFLSATIYVNEDGIFNDDKYEYDQIAFPFLSKLGRAVHSFELNRGRKFKPDLSKFKLHTLGN